MRERVIYSIPSLYRDDFRVKAYLFGQGEKALCIVGSMRGNEYQQLFIASRMVQRLKELEEQGELMDGVEIMVIPSVNPSSMNVGKRFWATDNTDINRMFPGYDLGETTQRIAAGVFQVVNQYRSGIQLASYYMPGNFSPHVRMMRTGFENLDKARDFGLPYIVLRTPRPYDTTTLNYNWQIWETDAYSLYSTTTDRIDAASAGLLVGSMERFMVKNGILRGTVEDCPPARLIERWTLFPLRPEVSGLYRSLVETGSHVEAGQPCAEIYDPCTGVLLETLHAPKPGTIFFQHDAPMVYAYTAAVKLLPDEEGSLSAADVD